MSIATTAASLASAREQKRVRVMVVDDAVVARAMVSRWIEAKRGMQVVGLTGAFKPMVERRNLYRASGRDASARNRTRAAHRLRLVGAPG